MARRPLSSKHPGTFSILRLFSRIVSSLTVLERGLSDAGRVAVPFTPWVAMMGILFEGSLKPLSGSLRKSRRYAPRKCGQHPRVSSPKS